LIKSPSSERLPAGDGSDNSDIITATAVIEAIPPPNINWSVLHLSVCFEGFLFVKVV